MSTQEQKRLEFDHLIVICRGCRGERKFYPDTPIVGAEQLAEWLKTIARCGCGATHCDVKARIKGDPAE